ncbi:MAG: hypothetical protein H8F28_13980 [Fibrella sp.]|nr:hypothetical protein [Armatimonadota bacterium]
MTTATKAISDRTSDMDNDPVRRAVIVAIRRLRQRRTIRYGATGFLAGSVVGLFFAVAISSNLLRETTLPGGGAFLFLPTFAGLLAGAFYGAAGKYDPVSVARLLERRLDLKERLSTALSTKRDGSPVIDAQHGDAVRHAPSESDVFSAVPLTPVPRRVYIAGAVALSVALTYFAPELPVFWSGTRRSEQVAVKKEGERLLAVAKAASAEAKKQNLPEAEKAAQKVEKLGKEMARGRMPLREALMERAKLSEELRKAQDKIAREQANRADKQTRTNLASTGRSMKKNLQNSGSTTSTNPTANTPDARMKALQDALARGDKNGVAQALREMADAAERGEPTPGAERDKTGQQLAALGDGLNKNNFADAGRAVEKAGDSMSNNAMPEAAQSLREAADKIEQSGSAGSQNGQSTQNQSGQSGSGGQAKEQTTLQKMMNDVQKMTGTGTSQSGNQSSQQGQSSQGNPSQSGSPQQGSGQQGAQGQGGPSQSGQSQNGKPGQGSQGGQQGQGNKAGQNGSPSNQSGQSGSQGGGSGNGKKSGQGQGKSSGDKRGKSGDGGGGKGSGDGSTGNAKTGDSAQRLGKGAKEQNVRGKQSGEGPETVITENDTDRSALPVSSLPYYKEFVKERGGPASESAQTRDAVPNAYRNQVRGYFDSLPPAPNSGAKGQ